MGGESLYFGKPHPPIYDLARRRLAQIGHPVADSRILAVGDGIAVVVQQGDVHPGARPAAGRETLWLAEIVLLLLQMGERHGGFGLAEALKEDLAPFLDTLFQTSGAHRRCSVEKGLEAREVRRLSPRVVEQRVDHDRDEEGGRDPVFLDRVEEQIRRETLKRNERAAGLKRGYDECRCGVRKRRCDQESDLLGPLPLGRLNHRHVGRRAIRLAYALGPARGAAGVDDRVQVVGADVRSHQGLRLECRRERVQVLASLAWTETQQVLQPRNPLG